MREEAQHRPAPLDQARALYQAGLLAEAEATCRTRLTAAPDDPDALHLLGVLADAQGDRARALALIEAALCIRETAQFRCNLGMVLLHLDQPDAALAACARALALRPAYPEALINQGCALEALDRPAEAAEAYRSAIALRPDHVTAWHNLANALRLLRRYDEAEAAWHRAIALNPASAAAQAGLGRTLRAAGRDAEAEDAFRARAALAPGDADAALDLAAALGEQDKAAEAETVLRRALPDAAPRPELHVSLGTALRQLGRLEEAEAAYRRALALRPDDAEALGGLGNALRELGRPEAAETVLRRALARRPAEPGPYNDLAIALIDQDRPHEALALLDCAAALRPDHAETRHHRSFVLLLLGRFAEGWADYEARFDSRQGKADRRAFAQPRWQGEDPAGRTLLLTAEQGFGDVLQFVRYVPLLARRGARVVLETPGPLLALLHSLQGVAVLVEQGARLPAFDRHAPLLSLPHLFGTTRETIPAAVPYLAPPEQALARWRKRLPPGGAPRIGLVWAGNPRHVNDRRRSLPAAALASLFDVPGLRWVSLQAGGHGGPLPGPAGAVEDLAPALTDFAETAAALRHLDLLITADTSAAHLAGALGVPAWVMLPAAPDWRWLRTGETSPWYPSLRLFRQDHRSRAWKDVVTRIAAALAEWRACGARAGKSNGRPC